METNGQCDLQVEQFPDVLGTEALALVDSDPCIQMVRVLPKQVLEVAGRRLAGQLADWASWLVQRNSQVQQGELSASSTDCDPSPQEPAAASWQRPGDCRSSSSSHSVYHDCADQEQGSGVSKTGCRIDRCPQSANHYAGHEIAHTRRAHRTRCPAHPRAGGQRPARLL